MADLQTSGWPCTQHAPEPTRRTRYLGVPIATASAANQIQPSIRSPYLDWMIGFGPGPFNTTPDTVIRLAVSPSLEVVLRVTISALRIKHTKELLVLPKRFATIAPANIIAVRILVPRRLPITPNRSLRLTSILFCDVDVGAFVGEDVFPSAPDTSMLVVRPYVLPSVVLPPRAGWPFWWSTGTPWWVHVG